jgi:hypothetical protein
MKDNMTTQALMELEKKLAERPQDTDKGVRAIIEEHGVDYDKIAVFVEAITSKEWWLK